MERGVVGRLIIIDSGSGGAGITVVKGRGCRRSMIVPPRTGDKGLLVYTLGDWTVPTQRTLDYLSCEYIHSREIP